MWLLILLLNVEGEVSQSVIHEYRSEKLCGVEKVRIELAFHRAYPYDRDYRFVCRRKGMSL
jgi:hypothetical protein